MCVPFTGSEAWTRSLGYKIVDDWRQWFSSGSDVAGYENLSSLFFLLYLSFFYKNGFCFADTYKDMTTISHLLPSRSVFF